MIFIVSIILMFCFALSAVFIGFTPNAYRLVDKDFVSKAIMNSELQAMRYGEVYLRARVLDTNSTTSTPDSNITMSRFTWITNSTNDTVSQINITSNITVSEDSEGVHITVSADKEN